MKIREFDIENYDIGRRLQQMVVEKYKELPFGGTKMKVSIDSYNVRIEDDTLSKINEKTMNEIVSYFKLQHKEKSEKVVKSFYDYKKHVDKILFDDKDYIELLEVLQDSYYCQALEMLQNILEAKTKGKSVKALKYQARKMQANNISCD